MSLQRRIVVSVRPASALKGRRRLFAALEAAVPVSFEPWPGTGAPADAALIFGDRPVPDAVPAFVVEGVRSAHAGAPVTFCDVEGVDRRVRNVSLERQATLPPIRPHEREAILAMSDEGPVWTLCDGPAPRHRVACALQELEQDRTLYTGLGSPGGVALIALVHFLRAVAGDRDWSSPPLRAALLFDDPNLRRRSYGYIDYPTLLRHADAHGYHAAMAMIPIDGSRAHAEPVRLFRERPDRLSLVVHGNDHLKRELLLPGDDASALALIAQAERRVRRFERRNDLRVDRVMTPPHGRCSAPVARALGTLGFDALCAIHPLPWTDSPPPERVLAGWFPADYAFGCPVIPRAPLESSHADLALRAMLNHPLVVYGHHDDLVGGLEVLERAVARVNRLGPVEWTSIGRIAEGNYATRIAADGRTAWLRPFSSRLRLDLPAGVTHVGLQAPPDGGDFLIGWSFGADGPVVRFGQVAPRPAGARPEIRLRRSAETTCRDVATPSWRPWPRLRRAGTELRDRARPLHPMRV